MRSVTRPLLWYGECPRAVAYARRRQLRTFAIANNRQPGSAVDIANYPIEAVSDVDCFHPSSDAHGRLAAGFWNRYHLDLVGVMPM